jgi:coenzyme F420-dependent glucose-6-phosphate dehydrogenase
VFLGVGTGEAMNETPLSGAAWPPARERRRRLAEAIDLMRRLWSEERVDFAGEHYTTRRATVYDRPEQPVPVYVAAGGPVVAKYAGRSGDGFICTSGKGMDLYTDKLIPAVEEGAAAAGREPAELICRFFCIPGDEEAALAVAARLEPEQVVVTVLPDTGERYLTMEW